jgi:hypothetical protein
MKYLLFFLLIPFYASSQTVNVEGDKVVYKGKVPVKGLSEQEIGERAKMAILDHVNKKEEPVVVDSNKRQMIISTGKIKLPSPHYIIKTMEFRIALVIGKGGYQYLIDSIILTEKTKGEETVRMSSEKLLKGMESSGPVAAAAEKQLNEIDMNIQKLIAVINRDIFSSHHVDQAGGRK